MDFIKKLLYGRAGYTALSTADTVPTTGSDLLRERGITDSEYQAMVEKTIRIIQAMSGKYLSESKAEAAVAAVRTGRYGFSSHPSSSRRTDARPFFLSRPFPTYTRFS